MALGEQTFAIEIMAVREIRGWTSSTRLAKAPPYCLGVISLRGVILPVLDLRARLGLGAGDAQPSSVVVVVEHQARVMGLLVDAVCDILDVPEDQIQPPPTLGSEGGGVGVRGLLPTEDGIVSLLALDEVLPAMTDAAA